MDPAEKMTRDAVYAELQRLVAEALNQYDAGYAVDVEYLYDELADKFYREMSK